MLVFSYNKATLTISVEKQKIKCLQKRFSKFNFEKRTNINIVLTMNDF